MKFQDGIKIMKTQKEKNTKKKRKPSKEVIPSGAWAVIRETALKFNILLVTHLRPSFLYFTQIRLWPICQQKNKVFYWEPRLKTLTSSETNPGWDRAVNRTNISTSGEMSVWIAQREPGMKKGISLCLSTVPYKETVISMGTCQTQPYQTRTTNAVNPKFRCTSSQDATTHFLIPDTVPVKKQEVHLTQTDINSPSNVYLHDQYSKGL